MICRKCGNSIENNSKFCGVCGEKIEELVQEQNIQSESVAEEIPFVVQPGAVKVEQSLQQTTVVEPVNFQPLTNENITPSDQTPEINTVQVTSTIDKELKKKNNTWIFAILGVLLGIIAVTSVYFAYSKFSNNSVKVLEKALSKLEFKGERSGTVDVKLLIQSQTDDSMNLSATMKYSKQGDDNYNFNLTLNKSMFFEEINVYASVLDEKATLFVNSSLIDMLGFTSSTPSMWVYMTTTEQDLEMQTGIEVDELEDIDLSDILDGSHFKLIDSQNNLKHYQLVIDNELVNKIKKEASKEDNLKNFANSLNELTENYYVDFYINNSNELVKISMDLTKGLNDESIKSAVMSFEFNNFGSTLVQIPTEVKNSTIDLETYVSTYAIMDDESIESSNQNDIYQH